MSVCSNLQAVYASISIFLEYLRSPTMGDTLFELMMFVIPLCVALLAGVLVGWAWKPKWAQLKLNFVDSNGNRVEMISSSPSLSSSSVAEKEGSSLSGISRSNCSSRNIKNEGIPCHVDDVDLNYFHKLVEEKDGGPSWIHMMEKSTPNMTYQAWRRDPMSGPPQYRSRTIYENATPEIVRDFFWDDEFRLKWDDMLKQAETLEECCENGTMVVRWIRKFPFFCSDREYVIGRRIWDCGSSYYCITKSVPFSSLARREKPRRVDLYYSSWCIRPAESKIDGCPTACEVLLFHHEGMGIPWEIAKLGVRQGMWGAVKKIDPALRAYEAHRSGKETLISRSACLARINTKARLEEIEGKSCKENAETKGVVFGGRSSRRGVTKVLLIGGAVAIACSLDRGLLSKAVIVGAARRFSSIGKRL